MTNKRAVGSWTQRWPDGLAVLALVLLPLLISGWWQLELAQPTLLSHDYVIGLMFAKSLKEFGTVYHNYHLGFPEGMNLMTFPLIEVAQLSIWAALSALLPSPMMVYGSFYAVAVVGSTLAAYGALRWLGLRPLLAALLALAFGCSFWVMGRSLAHAMLAFVVCVPWVVALCVRWAAGLPVRDWQVVAIALLAGCSGVYYAFFSAMLLGLTLLWCWAREPRSANVWRQPFMALGLIVGAFVLLMLPHFWAMYEQGMALPPRIFTEQHIWGLPFAKMLLPQTWPFMDFHLRLEDYLGRRANGESTAISLGWLGLLGFGLLVWVGWQRFVTQQITPSVSAAPAAMQALPLLLLLFVVGVLFSLPYGVGMVFNALIDPVIRSQNRIFIFLLFICLLALALLVQHWLLRLKRPQQLMVGATLLVLLALDLNRGWQYYAERQKEVAAGWAERQVAFNNAFVALNQRGLLRVWQWPLMGFPEGPSFINQQNGTIDFVHTEGLWPYVLDPNPARRWSFGLMRYQRAMIKQLEIVKMPEQSWLIGARCMGYDSMWVENIPSWLIPGTDRKMHDALLDVIAKQGIKPFYEDERRSLIDIRGVEPDQLICSQLDAQADLQQTAGTF